MMPSVARQELAGQRPGVGIDQPARAVEAVALFRVQRARRPGSDRAADLRAPGTKTLQMSPQRSVSGIEVDDVGPARGRSPGRTAAPASPSPSG